MNPSQLYESVERETYLSSFIWYCSVTSSQADGLSLHVIENHLKFTCIITPVKNEKNQTRTILKCMCAQ